ncbi:hypothetical protein [Streptomyces iconiensis]|uniref:Uncharacterized protein n=1 Tax=Streptomyces iconiensis TaxID=1384038 RepID=A0ABT7A9A1_9ACTN|nr:hypothetical protein [Streptomyces iconiensis]MDJ1137942.1 hypothetical protein [Streptomyces iconiensis]
MQSCRRHPAAGRFMRTCSGCATELYNLEQANAVRRQAREALAAWGMAGAERTVLSAARVGDVLVVATHAPESRAAEFAVDVFRQPTADELDAASNDISLRNPGEWVLIDQAGDDDAAAVPGMLRDADDRHAPTGEGVTVYPPPVDSRPTPGLRVTPAQLA